MKIDIMTLFPKMINAVMRESIIGRAQDKGLVEVKATNIRDYALDKHHKADDAPYGGGRGQVMLAEPLYLCHEALSAGEHVHTVFLSAQGAPFNQEKARQLLAKEHFILVCGHYEGIDQRFIDECVDEEISIGDFVLTGGEIPAMAVADARRRRRARTGRGAACEPLPLFAMRLQSLRGVSAATASALLLPRLRRYFIRRLRIIQTAAATESTMESTSGNTHASSSGSAVFMP